ncbi:MAG: cell division protein FtsH [Cyanobacteria bacterium QH_8_48_120]|jgi:cell division protease FtsH|nr:MAG: cell division protein FtsH [Cyanobacteria bacterium QH_1_48_107]PSO60763.1 MAG: cell division protein FtsH [Cyanobacteria bacterium QH_10_48_56]PSO63316.1 MAG: cell division protein FtsH [Cyanobacteria bacterium QH_6_48_35]PSO64383.1 MAG: cell division protein FtsH [Cyanobacteria bacterium QH_7_48_89]PSO67195.1 MAG: cell division protein FtsH [Cyanobacteria bacterium QS_1_48_34]PSO69791.1 MAG: cell division protein FtsH [Cyanobacteria bacterium QH_3_48_40]PSO73527.1 MAG: cell division
MPANQKNNNDSSNQKNSRTIRVNGGILLLVATVVLLSFALLSPGSSGQQVPYSKFIEQVKADQVEEATIGSERIEYKLTEWAVQEPEDPRTFETRPLPTDRDLTEILENHNVEYTGALQGGGAGWLVGALSWVLPPLLFFGIAFWLFNRSQGGAGGPAALSVGKSKARIYSEGNTGVEFKDVAGVDEAVEELQEVVDFLKSAGKYKRLGAKIPKGVLLLGAPGTGKTLLAKAVAGEANVPFFSISGSEFIEMFVGVGASRVRDLFQQAQQEAPCIVFIDELDTLGKSRGGTGSMTGGGGGNDEQEQTLNQLLNEMDGFDPNSSVIVLGATNRPEVLDPALQRPGRFDRQVVVDRPDKRGREAILKVHTPNVKLADDVDLSTIATRTPGFAGADLANLVNEAALLAARQNRNAVTMADFSEAIERVIAGLQKKTRVLNDTEKNTVAYHEVGHAMVGYLMPGAGSVQKISIVPRGVGALGYTLQLPEEDRFLVAEDEIRGRIAILLAGRSSEELIFGKVSTGASDDIQKATDLAERCVTLYGMSEELGPISFEKPQQQFLPGMGSPRRSVSPKVTEAIDKEVKEIVDGAHHMALKILEHNREILEETAQALLEQEVIETQAVKERLGQIESPPGLEEWLRTGKLPQGEELLQTALV